MNTENQVPDWIIIACAILFIASLFFSEYFPNYEYPPGLFDIKQ